MYTCSTSTVNHILYRILRSQVALNEKKKKIKNSFLGNNKHVHVHVDVKVQGSTLIYGCGMFEIIASGMFFPCGHGTVYNSTSTSLNLNLYLTAMGALNSTSYM